MGEAKRRRMIAAANARQAACGWDANGSPTVEENPRAELVTTPRPVRHSASPGLRSLLTLMAALGEGMGGGGFVGRRRW